MPARDPLRLFRGRASTVLLALALYALVFTVREVFGTPADGLTFLYLLPICLLSIDRGIRAGLGAAAVGLALVGVWDKLEASGLTPLAYVTRGIVFVGVGVLCGTMAARVRRAGREADRYFELSSQMLAILDFHGRPVRLNRCWSEVLGWSTQELMRSELDALVHPDDLADARGRLAQLARADDDTESGFTVRMLGADGSVHHVIVTITVDRESARVYLAAKDVTERHELEQARRVAEERFRVAFEDSATGMAVVALTAEHTGQIVEANEELGRILGIPREALLGLSGIMDFAHPGDAARLRTEMGALASGRQDVVRSEIRVVRPDDSVHWVHVTSSLLHDEDGEPRFRLSQIMDIDARRRADEQVRYLADHDAMSGLLNRRRFVDDLERELRDHAASRGAVLVIDLDGFKQDNDSAGHACGDEVIATVGRALTSRLRSGDLAGRMGGDEFGVLLRRVLPEQALIVARGLMSAAEAELAALEHPAARAVTLSIGVTFIDGTGRADADELLDRADGAMYAAKQDGGGRVELARDSLVP